jgi:hypothetical protein
MAFSLAMAVGQALSLPMFVSAVESHRMEGPAAARPMVSALASEVAAGVGVITG